MKRGRNTKRRGLASSVLILYKIKDAGDVFIV
jgi:hypothetical protein